MNEYRGELPISDEHLAQLGENTARSIQLEGVMRARPVRKGILKTLQNVEECRTQAAAWAASRRSIPQEIEWLLDNWYLAAREGRDTAECFRTAIHLPAARRTRRLPAVLELARGLAWARKITPERIAFFLERAQEVRPLTEEELSVFIPALKAALLERLAELCSELEPLLKGRGIFEEEARYSQSAKNNGAQEEKLQRAEEEHRRLSRIMEDIFTSFRTLSGSNLGKLLEESNRVEHILRRDPAGQYAYMDDTTRARYRREVCILARRRGIGQCEAAQMALELAEQSSGEQRHVGWFLFQKPLGTEHRISSGGFYLAAVILPTLFIVLLAGFLLHTPLVALLLLLPVSDIVKNCIDFLAVRLFRPRAVHRMELKDGVPAEGKTLCVIAALLGREESGKQLAALLEQYRLANRSAGKNLIFGILADLPDSGVPMGREARASIHSAQAAIEALNKTYGGGFYLFFRPPIYQVGDERYMGWERKRGALLELARLLRGKRSGLEVHAGEKKTLSNVRFVITLDSDTSLNVGAAQELIGAMLHPMNRPKLDRKRRIVTSGYGILQPRVGVEMSAANRSQFARIFAGQGGVDPYGSTTSDVYHDLFDQGTYTGKGIFDVDTFLFCLDGRFPKNTVLSHDLLEGSYLHAGLIGDVELTDSYPYKVTSYFARLHRWVRGDWQLLPWLGRYVHNEEGERVINPISPLAKWKIFDNLRRSLSPVVTLLALLLGMCISGPVFAAASVAAVLSAASNLLLSGAELAFRGGRGLRARYHSTMVAGFGGVILQTLVQLLFLPIQAWTCFSAAVTALWRSRVTHRGMLAWVTAADAEQRAGDGVWANYRKQWPAVAVGVVAMCCSIFPAGAAVGLIWVLSPVFAWAMSRPIKETYVISEGNRTFLLHQGALIWRYFDRFLTPEDHWLPPDNWQEQPSVGLARRTSPTNIGLGLLCVLSAVDLDYISRDRAVALLGHMLSTLERLPKWRGHLYNWYDTASTEPLQPRYVSTVDGGNLCGCLIALREGLYEWGEDALARRAEKLSDGMDFSLLYDKERKLFYIGYDAERDAYTQGWYDLMASEARQTSYLAIAKGQVEHRHWRRLSRMLVKENDYCGMASWTGTMFEYFMPNLLLPCERNSLMYESLAFCLYAQRRRAAAAKMPWGISESCFYAFDPAMNYQYKAHGVSRLGLKRGLDRELVISPYSSFLALLLAPESAVKNLRRLREMGLEGQYGFCEAADFTPSRLTGDAAFEAVRTYMAHHLGMSLVSVDNALKQNVMQERFMRDRDMAAYRELLQEKLPVGAVASRSPEREIPEKPRRIQGADFQRRGEGADRFHPACHLISNGVYTVFCSDSGATESALRDIVLTLSSFREENNCSGVSFFLYTEDGILLPFTAAPLWKENTDKYVWKFSGCGAKWSVKEKSFLASVSLRVPEKENGELREVELTWEGDCPLQGELVCYLEPVLARGQDYRAHPAFSKLFLESRAEENGIVFARRPRSRKEQTLALAVLWDKDEGRFDTSREYALGRGGLRALAEAMKRPATASQGSVLDPCLLLRVPVALGKNEKFQLRVALAAAESEEDAVLSASRLLRLPRAISAGRLDNLIHANKMTREDALQTFKLMEKLAFPSRRASGTGEVPCQEELWPFGISGDLPIAACSVDIEQKADFPVQLAKQYKLLSDCGFFFDLVFILSDCGDYRRPARSALLDALKRLGIEGRIGTKGGIYLVDSPSAGTLQPVCAAAAVQWDMHGKEIAPNVVYKSKNVKLKNFIDMGGCTPYTFAEDGTFFFEAGKGLPPVGWNHMLSNPEFGWMTDETGCGHLWCRNARENQLTPWKNDPLAVGGPEFLFLRKDGQCYSLFADGDGITCRIHYAFGYAEWEKDCSGVAVKLKAFIDENATARVFLISMAGDLAGAELLYRMSPLLASDTAAARFTETVWNGNCLAVQNPWNRAYWPQSMLVSGDKKPSDWGVDETGILWAVWNAAPTVTLVVGCAASRKEEQSVLALSELDFAEKALERVKSKWAERTGLLHVETPDPMLDRYLNGWALYQTMACRIFGRTSRYQSGGAYGFRDQLQDVCAVLPFAPELTRSQILSACSHQYREGDVQHWWHETMGKAGDRGVRTRISDDLLWLPYAICEYVEKLGDHTILFEKAPWLVSALLEKEEKERYEQPKISQEMDCAYRHGVEAIECVLRRGSGSHGLILMGSGDWNDGMNRVGEAGKGESVWLTWFAAYVLKRFSGMADIMGETERAVAYRQAADVWLQSADAAWDGAWFLRGYYDDGAPLGSSTDEACRIDSIAQSWSALAGGSRDRAEKAVRSALEQLFDRENGIVKLFTPPFNGVGRDPGYIGGYVQGVRENGGQYTHAAVWLALACFELGMNEEGHEILHALLPSGRNESIYRAEPYVLAADVYANPAFTGRGGWSWYTGAAGWYFRAATEGLLGLRLKNGRLIAEPNLPADWNGCTVQWKTQRGKLQIKIRRGKNPGVYIDGGKTKNSIDLSQIDGECCIEVIIAF